MARRGEYKGGGDRGLREAQESAPPAGTAPRDTLVLPCFEAGALHAFALTFLLTYARARARTYARLPDLHTRACTRNQRKHRPATRL